jgi:hypothetical protein
VEILTAKMLKHAGLLEPQDSGVMPFDETVDLELRWKEWLRREHNNRYTKSLFPTHSGRHGSYIESIPFFTKHLKVN